VDSQSSEQHARIELFGKSYTLKAESGTASAQAVADYLLAEVKRVESEYPGAQSRMSKLDILILAAMNIANEHIELKEKHSTTLEEISERSSDLIRRLDSCLSHRAVLSS